ncbi:MAG: archaellin/type IV pilin N-terminal domain-containing protein [Thermoproteota archaeon]
MSGRHVNRLVRACAKRALSPLLATIILIAITVAAGLVVYSLFFSAAGTASTHLNIQVISADIVKGSDVNLVAATVKNTGNKMITSCTITFFGDSGSVVLDLGNIEIGQTKSASGTTMVEFTAGKSYPVKIEVEASDGSKMTKSLTITCMG